jgi:hypothetical protein
MSVSSAECALLLDFAPEWLAVTPLQYAHAAWQVKQIVEEDLGFKLGHVILSTDETDEEWL